jgi:hypothetical protein
MEKTANTDMARPNATGNREEINDGYQQLPGWGMDADPENEPTYPIKKYNGADHQRLNYQRPPLQPVEMEILHSNERPNVTAVFGTSTPPSGVSGMLRRYAFRYSEGSAAHWMTLIFADRINVVEGIVDDLRHGHIPNIFAEKGWNAEWKYNRKGLVKKIAVTALVTAAAIAWLSRKKKRA